MNGLPETHKTCHGFYWSIRGREVRRHCARVEDPVHYSSSQSCPAGMQSARGPGMMLKKGLEPHKNRGTIYCEMLQMCGRVPCPPCVESALSCYIVCRSILCAS